MTAFGREAVEVEALRTDRYLDALLAQRDLGAATTVVADAVPGPGAATGPAPALRGDVSPPDPAIRTAVDALDRALMRVHPSFRFEERLAHRLAEVADAMRVSAAAGAEGVRVPVALPFDPGIDPADPRIAGAGTPLPSVPRPLLIGAASAALSIGAAIVAWRLGRPVDPMARAVRAVHGHRGVGHVVGTARID